jgi:two-component system chemotaxis response regulator CheY
MDKAALRILTVDDHHLSLRLVGKQLGFMGFQKIETASNGVEAEKRLAVESFDIVLLDWAMPQKDGLTLLKECRAQERFKNTAFAMLSSEAQPHMMAQAMEAGAATYIVKPVTQDVFAENMEKVLAWLEKNRVEKKQAGAPVTDLHGLLDEILNRTGNELMGAISDSVMKTVETLFGKQLEAAQPEKRHLPSAYAATVKLTQGQASADLRLVFDRALLETLVSEIYSREEAHSEAVLKDAASEISNIVCNRIKAFANAKGMTLETGFPRVDDADKPPAGPGTPVSLNFSLVKNMLSVRNMLRVDMS